MSGKTKHGLLLFLIALSSFVFYVPMKFDSLMGDDFTSFQILHDGSGENLITRCFARGYLGIYRPLNMLYIHGRTLLFGTDYSLYFYGNLLLGIAASWMVFHLLWRISRAHLLAAVLGLFYALHHFQYYLVLIRTGEVDLLTTALFVVFLAVVVLYLEQP